MGHNARKLTQVNKSHKDSSKAKSNSKKSLVTLNKKKALDMSKDLRILKAEQHRANSIKSNSESDYSKRGSNTSAPLLCGIFPLFEFKDIDVVLSLLKSTDQDVTISKIDEIENYSKLSCENFIMKSKKFKKNFAFTACKDFRDRFDYLDLAKVVDWCLFILPNDLDELIGDYTEDLISSLMAQGFPSSCFITLKNSKDFKLKDEVKYFEAITKISLGEERIQCLNNINDANKLMRHLSQNCKPSFIASKKSTICSKSVNKKRGYFLIQNMCSGLKEKELKLTGCMRGFGVDMNTTKFIHVTEVGDLEIKEIAWVSPEESNRTGSGNVRRYTVNHDAETVEKTEDMEEKEEEEEEDIYEDNDKDSDDDDSEQVSDLGSDDSDEDKDDKMSYATTAHSGYSIAQIQKFKESRENSMFPDEVEISLTEKAKDKFKKYRGLKGFKSSEWPLDRDLPDCYAHIHSFKKYQHERNRLCNTINQLNRDQIDNFVKPGSKFEIVLQNVNSELLEQIKSICTNNSDRHFVASNLFAYETRISVLHLNERRLAAVDDSVVNALAKFTQSSDSAVAIGEEAMTPYDNLDEKYNLKPNAEPIESKEAMLFQIGFRRFSSTPIYSESTATSGQPGNKGKSKYCQFMELKKDVVATVYGPVTYGPVPVLQFRIRQMDLGTDEMSQPFVGELVASGSLLSIDPSRPIIKRIMLSGQIYKVHKRSVMVRYMFFSTEDIEYFKEVPLHTKSNKVGRIIGPHGDHGYMRCHFDKAVQQDEMALMSLYKRVFPKYTVENMYKHLPNADHIDDGQQAVWEAMDMLF